MPRGRKRVLTDEQRKEAARRSRQAYIKRHYTSVKWRSNLPDDEPGYTPYADCGRFVFHMNDNGSHRTMNSDGDPRTITGNWSIC